MFCDGKRVVSEETQDSMKASVTISSGSINPSVSKCRIQGNAKQLFHGQFVCIKQENEDDRDW